MESHSRREEECGISFSTQPWQQREDKRQRLKLGPRPTVKPRLLPAQSSATSTTPSNFYAPNCLDLSLIYKKWLKVPYITVLLCLSTKHKPCNLFSSDVVLGIIVKVKMENKTMFNQLE